MFTGTVKFFNDQKGFGFIKYTNEHNEEKEVFVHISGIRKEGDELTENERIHENDNVSFDVEEGRKGENAIDVRRI